MTALSLFSGIGGLDLAAEAAGIRTIAFCEREPFCRRVLAKHWPDVPVFDDVFELRGCDIGGAVDVIHGGFPCQPFSVAGRQRGKDDERYLWPEFSRLVGELKPRWVVGENVSGIMRIAADDICADLENRGYEVGIWSFEAAAVGCLHRRMRVFFVAHAGRELSTRPADIRDSKTAGRKGAADIFGQAGEISRSLRNAAEVDISNAEYNGSFAAEEYGRAESKESGRPEAGQEAPEQSAGICHKSELVPDAECKGLQEREQERIRAAQRERAADRADSSSGSAWRTAQPRLGGVAHGFSRGVDLFIEPDIPRTVKGGKDRAARLKALGNAVVPAQAYPIFKAIAEIEGGSE